MNLENRRRVMMQGGGGGIVLHQMIDFSERRQMSASSGAGELYPYQAILPKVDAIIQGHILYLTLMLQVESGIMTQSISPYFSGSGTVFAWASLRSPRYTTRQAVSLSKQAAQGVLSFMLYHSSAFDAGTIVTVRPMIFDLTADFGEGNEPSLEEFEAMIGSGYYEYGEHII